MNRAFAIAFAILGLLLTSCSRVKPIPGIESLGLAKSIFGTVILLDSDVPLVSNVGGIMYSSEPKLVAGWNKAAPSSINYFVVQFSNDPPTVLHFDTLEQLNRHLARIGLSSLDMRHEVTYEDIDQRMHGKTPQFQHFSPLGNSFNN